MAGHWLTIIWFTTAAPPAAPTAPTPPMIPGVSEPIPPEEKMIKNIGELEHPLTNLLLKKK